MFWASSGPDDWERLDVGDTAPREPLPPVQVTNVETDTDRISFDVDQIGVPVLVRASYFPNWKVSGGDGPYRVTPNLMVVVPTDTHVDFEYGWTAMDIGAWVMTVFGIVGVVVLARLPAVPGCRPLDEAGSDGPPEPDPDEALADDPDLGGPDPPDPGGPPPDVAPPDPVPEAFAEPVESSDS